MKELPYPCPKCGSMISLDEVNVAKDTVICKTCATVSSLSELQKINSDAELIKKSPLPKGLKVEKTKKGMIITYKKLDFNYASFLIFSLLLNGGLWVTIIGVYFENITEGREHSTFEIFAAIFLGVLAFGLLLYAMIPACCKTVMALRPGQGELYRGIGNNGRRWTFLLNKDCTVEFRKGTTSGQIQPYQIFISQPTGKPFTLCSSVSSEDTLHYICAILRQFRA